MTERGSLTYLYAIVPADADEPDTELRGIDDTPVALLRAGAVAAVVSEVDAASYGDDALNAHLDDLAWVGERGVAHERVLDWYAERGPVIPLSLFSIHADADRVASRIGVSAAEYARTLGRLAGRKEWGIRLWRDDAAAREGVDRFSATLQELAGQIEAAPAGKRFLLERKRDTIRTEEVRAVSKRLAHEVFAALRGLATAAVSIPLPPANAGTGERTPLLHAAFLVEDAAFDAFRRGVGEQAARLGESGFRIEFTGPWPPYNFAHGDDDESS